MTDTNRWGKEITDLQQGLAKRLKDAREAAGLTLEEVGKIIGVSKVTVLRYERADIAVPSDRLERLATLYRVSPAYLMGWDNPDSGYYIDAQAAEYAEELRTNKDLRVLFSASRDLSKEQMKETYDYIKYLKSKETNNDY